MILKRDEWDKMPEVERPVMLQSFWGSGDWEDFEKLSRSIDKIPWSVIEISRKHHGVSFVFELKSYKQLSFARPDVAAADMENFNRVFHYTSETCNYAPHPSHPSPCEFYIKTIGREVGSCSLEGDACGEKGRVEDWNKMQARRG